MSSSSLPTASSRRTSQKLDTSDVVRFIRSGTLTDDESVKKMLEDNYYFGDVIGKGAFGTVRIAVDRRTGFRCACKYMDKRAIASSPASSQSPKGLPLVASSPTKEEHKGLPMLKLQHTNRLLKSEIDILQSLDHPNIIKLLDIFENRDGLWLMIELAEKGPLLNMIKAKGRFSEEESVPIISQVVDALIYLHENGIIHRDIKPENILITEGDIVKLTDFGLSTVLVSNWQTVDTTCGTVLYMAPEVIKGHSYSFQADMWSLGVVIFHLLCGYVPFVGQDRPSLVKSITSGRISFPHHGDIIISRPAQDLIRRLLQLKPSDRYSAKEVLLHPFISRNGDHSESMPTVVDMMRSYNAERKLKKGIHAVIAASRFRKDIHEEQEEEEHRGTKSFPYL